MRMSPSRNGGLSSVGVELLERHEHRRRSSSPRSARRSRRSRAPRRPSPAPATRAPRSRRAAARRASRSTRRQDLGGREQRAAAAVDVGAHQDARLRRMPQLGGAPWRRPACRASTSASLNSASFSDGHEHRRLVGRHADRRARRQRLPARDRDPQRRRRARAPTACATADNRALVVGVFVGVGVGVGVGVAIAACGKMRTAVSRVGCSAGRLFSLFARDNPQRLAVGRRTPRSRTSGSF